MGIDCKDKKYIYIGSSKKRRGVCVVNRTCLTWWTAMCWISQPSSLVILFNWNLGKYTSDGIKTSMENDVNDLCVI